MIEGWTIEQMDWWIGGLLECWSNEKMVAIQGGSFCH